MFLGLEIVGGLTYLAIAWWMFGYLAGIDGRGERSNYIQQGLDYYWNEGAFYLMAGLWPLVLAWTLVRKIAKSGYNLALKQDAQEKQRAEIEARFRVELAKAEQELEQEMASLDEPIHSHSIGKRA